MIQYTNGYYPFAFKRFNNKYDVFPQIVREKILRYFRESQISFFSKKLSTNSRSNCKIIKQRRKHLADQRFDVKKSIVMKQYHVHLILLNSERKARWKVEKQRRCGPRHWRRRTSMALLWNPAAAAVDNNCCFVRAPIQVGPRTATRTRTRMQQTRLLHSLEGVGVQSR